MLDSEFALQCLQFVYDFEGTCRPLEGYTEYNYHITTTEGQQFVLKIAPEESWDEAAWEFQAALLGHLNQQKSIAPAIQRTSQKKLYGTFQSFKVRLLSWQEGNLLASLPYFVPSVMSSLATLAANNIRELSSFEHDYAARPFRWNSDQGIWTKDHIGIFSTDERDIITHFINGFQNHQATISKLPKSVIHNDLNEYNLLYSTSDYTTTVDTAIDYGDACLTSRINNLAIPISYMMQKESDLLAVLQIMVSSFNQVIPLEKAEIKSLYYLIGIRLVISVTQSKLAQQEDPSNAYLPIHYTSSMKVLKALKEQGSELVTLAATVACGLELEIHHDWKDWATEHSCHLDRLFPDTIKKACLEIDLGLESPLVPHHNDPYYEEQFQLNIDRYQREHHDKYLTGGYGEVRNFYVTEAFAQASFGSVVHRTKHLGIDIWENAGTRICSPWNGRIVIKHRNNEHKDYGHVIIVQYEMNTQPFYLLFGHLSEASYMQHKEGDLVEAGDTIGWLGSYEENGHWTPHLHLQVILDLLGQGENFDGVARPDQWHLMSQICPDPSTLFPQLSSPSPHFSREQLLSMRKEKLGYGLSLSYEKPLWIVRGNGSYLIDHEGQAYLDTVNNVAHVGHENYRVVEKAKQQISILNTNTRYLYAALIEYAEELLKTFPPELSVVHMTNSGSEANELALRMAKTYKGRQDMLAIEVGYHGNTGQVIEVSSYKFDAKGGQGKPSNTHLLPLPDDLRGVFSGDGSQKASRYVSNAVEIIEDLNRSGIELAGFIHESILSCGGQIVLPKDYLKAIYQAIRAQGGLCIADEVQVGFGRTGQHFWGFELQDVVPDIVVLGKPIGNGHPMGAVVCTPEVANSFNNGMEYFNTFGGNPVSATIGKAVLGEIKDNKLQENAWLVGSYIKRSLEHLRYDYPIIAEVRGYGLFLGIEFLDEKGNPDAGFATAFAEHMLARKILISTDGPDHNVIKIKPPVIFSLEEADILLTGIKAVMSLLCKIR